MFMVSINGSSTIIGMVSKLIHSLMSQMRVNGVSMIFGLVSKLFGKQFARCYT